MPDPVVPETTHWLYLPSGRRLKLVRGVPYIRHAPERGEDESGENQSGEDDFVESAHEFLPLSRSIRADLCPDATPAARRLASDEAVPLANPDGSGQDGRITKADVQAHLASPRDEEPAPGPPAPDPSAPEGAASPADQ